MLVLISFVWVSSSSLKESILLLLNARLNDIFLKNQYVGESVLNKNYIKLERCSLNTLKIEN
jgi:hypothetical protein